MTAAGQVWRYVTDGSLYLLLGPWQGPWAREDRPHNRQHTWRSLCLENPGVPTEAGEVDRVCIEPGSEMWRRVT